MAGAVAGGVLLAGGGPARVTIEPDPAGGGDGGAVGAPTSSPTPLPAPTPTVTPTAAEPLPTAEPPGSPPPPATAEPVRPEGSPSPTPPSSPSPSPSPTSSGPPEAVISDGSEEVVMERGSYCWSDDGGAGLCADTAGPGEQTPAIEVAAGQTLTVRFRTDGAPNEAEVRIEPVDGGQSTSRSIAAANPTSFTAPEETGDYFAVISTLWDQGDASWHIRLDVR